MGHQKRERRFEPLGKWWRRVQPGSGGAVHRPRLKPVTPARHYCSAPHTLFNEPSPQSPIALSYALDHSGKKLSFSTTGKQETACGHWTPPPLITRTLALSCGPAELQRRGRASPTHTAQDRRETEQHIMAAVYMLQSKFQMGMQLNADE